MNDIDIKAGVKPGDIVCDCRNKHLRVVSATPEYVCATNPPDDSDTWTDEQFDQWQAKQPKELYDYDLILEDGSNCSARHCCVKVPHPEWPDTNCTKHSSET